ncbi:hypothetical protein [Falsirhodobacter sp. alg1]|uniref:hypothetical protein n=1 Tax=Falsirhodobacter sp. alg1 TaxID=1472418 RepID=UPI00128EFAFA|nr:hypothetical protein [Falsirhodobacter sp. alg1]
MGTDHRFTCFWNGYSPATTGDVFASDLGGMMGWWDRMQAQDLYSALITRLLITYCALLILFAALFRAKDADRLFPVSENGQ